MLKNYTATESPITWAEKAPHEFYLTGSRYFGNSKPESDYDFFVQYSTQIMDFLNKEGFTLCQNSQFYYDKFLMLYNNTALVYTKDNIHIQLVNNVNHKHKCQELIYKSFYAVYKALPKDSRRLLWDAMFNM